MPTEYLRLPPAATPEKVGRIRVPRWVQQGVIAALLFTAARLALRQFDPPEEHGGNLALHRQVEVVTPHPWIGLNSGMLVDGDRENLGFHTIDGVPNQRVTIDLGSAQSISKVVVYNRADCCQFRALPLTLELSEDGISFRRIAERTEPFARWDADFPKTRARYVRLIDGSTNPFHLSEVEVY